MATAQQVIDTARGELGYCRWDDPLNGTKYGRWYADLVGDSGYSVNGVAYCAMFVSWVLAKVNQSAPGIPGAYCPWIVTAGKNAGMTVSTRNATFGDIVLFDWGGDGVSDHIGFVESNNGSYLTCIEGNTTGADGRSGSVARRTRAYNTVICIIRPKYGEAYNPAPPAPVRVEVHNLQTWEYNNSDAQKWWIRDCGDGVKAMRSAGNWFWLSDPNSSTTTADAQLWGGDAGNVNPRDPQKLTFERVADGIYRIHPVVAPNLSLDVEWASSDSGAKVQWFPTNETKAQQWFVYQDGNAYRLVNVAGMKALDSPNGGYTWI